MRLNTLEGEAVAVRWQFIDNVPVMRGTKPLMIKSYDLIRPTGEDVDLATQKGGPDVHDIIVTRLVPAVTTETHIFIEGAGPQKEGEQRTVLFTTSVKRWHLEPANREKARKYVLGKAMEALYPFKKPVYETIVVEGKTQKLLQEDGDDPELIKLMKKARQLFWDAYFTRSGISSTRTTRKQAKIKEPSLK